MPTYTVHAPAGRLDAAQRARIAAEITRVHNEATGAQTFFAQVMFVDVPAGHWFVGGKPMTREHVFVHGQIRAGRSTDLKASLLVQLLAAVGEAGGFERTQTWGYIVDVEAAQMVEYGHVLPQPGTEKQWLANLPAADRALMEQTGR